MKARLWTIWEALRSSYWFLPTLISLLAVAVSIVTLDLDGQVRYQVLQDAGWVYTGGPEGARAVLATIAGSIITVAGTTFSITIAVLSMASAQFGPRLLRNFMRDRANQTVLGVFVATFLYCLLVLRTVRGTDNNTYVPHISVTVGVAMAVVSLSALIFFIHHIAESIQISNMIVAVGTELDDTFRRLFPSTAGEEGEPVEMPREQSRAIPALSSGYVQNIETGTILEIARRADAIVHLRALPGEYVIAGMPLVEAWTRDSCPELDEDAVRSSFVLGSKRTPDQDAVFAILQLVELAVRALSPGINDPFTAIMCIDRISGALCILAERSLPSAYRLDSDGRVRVIAPPFRYEQLVHAAFSQIRENGGSHTTIAEHLRQQIDVVLSRAANAEFRAALEYEKSLLPGALVIR